MTKYEHIKKVDENGKDLPTEDIREQIVQALSTHGSVFTFGSDRRVDAALKSLKNDQVVRFVKKADGGNGWELIAAEKRAKKPKAS